MRLFMMLILSLISLVSIQPALAQDGWIAEGLPHHLRARVATQRQALLIDKLPEAQRYYVSVLKRWDPDQTIRVCFFGGSKGLRAQIAKIASAWSAIDGTGIRFDFGSMDDPRHCKLNEFNHIRIGYSYKGYWSLVGKDSIEEAPQAEQSMNLGRFNVNPPSDPEFTRVVLHEFGHALGFHHEHQNAMGPCQSEFDWPVVEEYLKGSPNYWTKEDIDFNMRASAKAGTEAGTFDKQSIMLYEFPREFYLKRERSACFTAGNSTLSDGDKVAARKLYPSDKVASQTLLREARTKVADAIGKLEDVDPASRLFALARMQKQVPQLNWAHQTQDPYMTRGPFIIAPLPLGEGG